MFKTANRALGATVLLVASGITAQAEDVAARKDVKQTTAVIETVDYETRQFLLTLESGRTLSLVAGPEVTNFDQIEDGDRVSIDFVEAVAVTMAEPAAEGAIAATVEERGGDDEKPAFSIGEVANFVVEFISYDPNTHIVTFILPSGEIDAVQARAEMWAFASTLQSGDKVEVLIERALAISVTPIGG